MRGPRLTASFCPRHRKCGQIVRGAQSKKVSNEMEPAEMSPKTIQSSPRPEVKEAVCQAILPFKFRFIASKQLRARHIYQTQMRGSSSWKRTALPGDTRTTAISG